MIYRPKGTANRASKRQRVRATLLEIVAVESPDQALDTVAYRRTNRNKKGVIVRFGQDERMGQPITLPPPESFAPAANPHREAILEQLERIVASPLFASSKRYPGLLRYVVENAAGNPACDLKERTIGIDVFGREPSYDTNHDPVVRTSAVEVRKRLIQYYQDPAHEGELRIELQVGSYVPRFHFPAGHEVDPAPSALDPRSHRKPIAIAAAGIVLIAAAIWLAPWRSRSVLDRFWAPLLDSPEPVLIGISGGPAASQADQTLTDLFHNRADYVPMGDVTAMAHILANFRERGKAFNLVYDNAIQLADLKAKPAILIGPMSRWLEMMSKDLRFTIERDANVTQTWIADRQYPHRRDWSVQIGAPASSVAQAYALISRVWNPTTGNYMICISGLSPYATSAAGDFVSDPDRMRDVFKDAPSGWERRNVQIVIAATRVGTNVGIPRAIAAYFW
jgi:hypothetical protein